MKSTLPPRPAGPPHQATAPGDAPASRHGTASAGHLARLVQRTRPAEALLQRRQPSLFEPMQPGVPTHGVDDEPMDAMGSAPATSPRPAEPVAAWRTWSQRPEPGAVETVRPRPPAPAPAAPPPARQELRLLRETLRIDASVRTVHTVSPATERQARQVASGQAGAPPTAGRMAAFHPMEEAPAPRPSPSSPREETGASRPRPPGDSAALSLAKATTAASTPAPLLRPTHTPSVRPASLPRSIQRAATAQSVHRQQPPRTSQPRELPPVQVTIGRIEVRAVAAPAAATERKAMSAPRMSLDQYLRERQGGGR